MYIEKIKRGFKLQQFLSIYNYFLLLTKYQKCYFIVPNMKHPKRKKERIREIQRYDISKKLARRCNHNDCFVIL